MKLKHKTTGKILYESKHETIKEIVEGAIKEGANLREADLQGTDLFGANLQGADLQGADLWGANLQGADLRRANLQGADLRRADLRRANLQGADLRGANLWKADLNALFYKTKVTKEQKEYIFNSDLFEVDKNEN